MADIEGLKDEAPEAAVESDKGKKPKKPRSPKSEPPAAIAATRPTDPAPAVDVDDAPKTPEAPSGNPAILSQPVPADSQDYVVERNVSVAWRGRIVKMREGTIVNEENYGVGCVERFRNAGVKLSPKSAT